jgi:hypothetical protein
LLSKRGIEERKQGILLSKPGLGERKPGIALPKPGIGRPKRGILLPKLDCGMDNSHNGSETHYSWVSCSCASPYFQGQTKTWHGNHHWLADMPDREREALQKRIGKYRSTDLKIRVFDLADLEWDIEDCAGSSSEKP